MQYDRSSRIKEKSRESGKPSCSVVVDSLLLLFCGFRLWSLFCNVVLSVLLSHAMCGSRGGGAGGPDTPEKSPKFRVF